VRRHATWALAAPLRLSALAQTGLATTPWAKYGYNSQYTGRSPSTGPATPVEQWSFATGNRIDSSPTVGADGALHLH
jgi:hypothetical protein